MTRFDETIKVIQNITNDIRKKADELIDEVDPSTASKINSIASKTIDTLQEVAVRLKTRLENLSDEEEVDKFLDRVVEKCEDAKEYAFNKFSEIEPYLDSEYEQAENYASSTMEKFLENENVKRASEFIINKKDQLVDYLTSEETKQKAKEISYKLLCLVDKGLDIVIDKLDKNANK